MPNLHGVTTKDPAKLAEFRELAKTHLNEQGSPNLSVISRILGVPRSTLQGWVRGERQTTVEFPSFVTDGDEEESIDELLARRRKGFERKAKAHAARHWFSIKVNEEKPYGVLFWGDPHLDDDGANFPLLEQHLNIAARDGIYSVNIGDTHNNWVGRLERLYAHQETSKSTAKRLVEWFMWDSGATWLCWLIGNHDAWSDGSDFLQRLAARSIPVIDWRAQFRLVHPDGSEVRIDASHGRKGSSIWNNLHATLRAAKLGELADCYVTGHTHNFGLEQVELADKRHTCWLLQLRGYKWFDTHALHNNFAESQMGSSILAVINPRPDARTRVQCFEDVQFGADYLAWLRR